MRSSRRKFFSVFFTVASAVGLVAAIGQLGRIVVRFLYPSDKKSHWFFVVTIHDFAKGKAMEYVTPDGQSVAISRMDDRGEVSDFIALSNVCPHLGCKVHWEGHSKTFFCPCHNGRFDSIGKPIEGPPKKANQKLVQFPLKVEKGLLYIELSPESLLRLSELNQNHRGCSKGRAPG